MSGTGYIDQLAIQLGPDGNSPSIRPIQRIAGTGATEASNATAFQPGEWITIQNATGAQVVFLFAASPGLVGVVSPTTGGILPALGQQDYLITPRNRYVYVEAYDGVAAFDVRAWQSSGNPSENV